MNRFADSQWLKLPAAPTHAGSWQAAETRQARLTKPHGSLGRLEEIAIRLAALQGTDRPRVERVHISVFAGDHGVAAEGVSAFPQSVTGEMVKNFSQGGAAINVAARAIGADLEVINLGTVHDTEPLPRVKNHRLGPGTANITQAPAMTEQQLYQALTVGRLAVERARFDKSELFIGGEMGIGNSTAATALACAMLGADPCRLTGPGTGLDAKGLAHKTHVIQKVLQFHLPYITSPLEALRRIGGFEIAALTGAYVACAQTGLPAMVDGYIAGSAALVAARLCLHCTDWLFFSHTSAEPGHAFLLDALEAQSLLDLNMRLGEGSGAAIAVPLLRMACALHNEMATFAEARVAGGC